MSAGYGKWYARNATGTELSFSYDTEPVAYFPRREVGFVGGAFTEGNITWHQIKSFKNLNDQEYYYTVFDKINCNNCPSELLFSVLGETGSGFRYPTSDLYFINDLHGWAITGHGEKHGGGSTVSEISELMYYYGDPSNSYGGPASTILKLLSKIFTIRYMQNGIDRFKR